LGRAGRSWNGPERTGEAGDAEAATAAVRVDSMVASSSRGGRGDGSGSGSGNRRRPPPSSERVGSVERGDGAGGCGWRGV
jgi:hypothetical protein